MNRRDQLIDDPIQSYAAFQRKQRRYRIAIAGDYPIAFCAKLEDAQILADALNAKRQAQADAAPKPETEE